MDVEQAKRVTRLYVQILEERGVVQGLDPSGLSQAHALYMALSMLSWLDGEQFHMEQKFMRWLGWLQCLLAVHGIREMKKMREDNR